MQARQPEKPALYMIGKRTIDFIVASAALLVLSPALLVAAFLIWRQDYVTPMFVQRRIGMRGRPFNLLKFRTMVANAEALGSATARTGDPRITRLGAILRKTKIDELPQLTNILKGEMSLVGPRPTLQLVIDRYTPTERSRILSIRPGVTGLSSILFSDLDEMMKDSTAPEQDYLEKVSPWVRRLEALYVDRHSLKVDVQLVYLTVFNFVDRRSTLASLTRLVERLGADSDIVAYVASRRDAAGKPS